VNDRRGLAAADITVAGYGLILAEYAFVVIFAR